MSYTSRTFSDGDTLTASNMNEIKSEISELYSKSTGLIYSSNNTISDMLSDLASLKSGETHLFSIGGNSEMSLALTGNVSSTSLKGFITVLGSGSIYDFIAIAGSGSIIYTGRMASDGTISSIYQYTGTSML